MDRIKGDTGSAPLPRAGCCWKCSRGETVYGCSKGGKTSQQSVSSKTSLCFCLFFLFHYCVCGLTVADFCCLEASATVVVRLQNLSLFGLTGGLRVKDRILIFIILVRQW